MRDELIRLCAELDRARDHRQALEEAYHGQRNAGLEMKAELRREDRAAAE